MAEIEIRADGTRVLLNTDCFAPVGGGAPQVTPQIAAQQVQKLVPHPEIGVAPPGGVSLVNIQTLLWVDTPVDRSLGTVMLLGQRVQLRVHVLRIQWEFGDGATDETASPGMPYSPADPCNTSLCPGYYGHVYASTGPMQITAQVSWTGEFQVGAGAWQPIAGTVTGPVQATTITVRQARGVLVPDPSGPGGGAGS